MKQKRQIVMSRSSGVDRTPPPAEPVMPGGFSHQGPGQDSFCGEAAFQGKLLFERQRTDRSGLPFLLILIELDFLRKKSKGTDAGNLAGVENRLIAGILPLIRQTDMAGWFAYPDRIGVVYTLLCPEKQEENRDALLRRVKDLVAAVLPPEALKGVRISSHLYPTDFDGEKDSALKRCLYPGHGQSRRGRSAALGLKRMLDFAVSAAGLVLLSPALIVMALLVKTTSPGPVFFRQKRLGLQGTPFEFLKFRTMIADNDPSIHKQYVESLIGKNLPAQDGAAAEGGGPVYKLTDDPRVTRVGRFLRKTSLDEIPQFINVLKGEMSLIGPRPPIPYELEHYKPWHRRRIMEVKPGITGLWQVRGRSRCDFDEMVRLDLQYIREWSLWLDIKILLQTPWAMISGAGGY